MKRLALIAALSPVLLPACGTSSPGSALDVGSDDGGLPFFASDDAAAPADGVLAVSLTSSTSALCPGQCTTLTAQATGGTPPYTFRWGDGADAGDGATATVCPASTGTFTVTASDGSMTSSETPGSTLSGAASVTVTVSPSCADAAASPGDAGTCSPDAAASGPAAALPEVLMLDVTGPPKYFGGGAAFPPGRYRVEYVDGCMMWGPATGGFGWSVGEGLTVGVLVEECILVGDTSANIVGILPGIEGSGVPKYADCVAASKKLPPLDFDFAGGKLGIFNNDTVQFDDVGGESQGGTSPTWRLSLLSACP
jgi:hypothetical protein